MDADRIQQLQQIVALSTEMLAHANSDEWDKVAELDARRRGAVMRCFRRPATAQDTLEVASAIRETLRLNQEISELARVRRDAIGGEIRSNKLSRVAQTAYLGCSR